MALFPWPFGDNINVNNWKKSENQSLLIGMIRKLQPEIKEELPNETQNTKY